MSIKEVFKIKDLRKKIFFTLFMLFIFRMGAVIPIPGVDSSVISSMVEENSLLSIYNMMVGGAFSSFTLFALGIGPYITAGIIIQLLTKAEIGNLEDLSKSGELGRKKINTYTKVLALFLGIVQSIGITYGFVINALKDNSILSIVAVIMTLVASSMFLIWISDKITEKGLGNGSSLIIFFGIISRLPSEVISIVNSVKENTINPWLLALVLLISLLVIIGVVFIQEGVRKIPVQYSKQVVGRKTYGGQSSHIPMKINQSGVMPVIFASSILALPQTIAMFVGGDVQNFVVKYLSPNGEYFWIYLLLEVFFIVLFSYFATTLSFSTEDIANNLKNSGGFIPGIRPGKPTEEYLEKILKRLTLAGAFFLSIIVMIPAITGQLSNIYLTLTGTSLLIVVGVALEIVRQLKSNLIVRNYSSIFSNK